MIENIRKYTGLIIFFMALVVVALVVGIKDDLFRGGGGGLPVLKIDGRTYSEKEFRRLGTGAFDLASSLLRSGDFGPYQFLMSLSTGATSEKDAPEKFFIGRMIIRGAKEEFGVHPSEEEISDYIRSLRTFTGPDGAFNQEAYTNFIEKGIGRFGMTESDLRELVADAIAARKINEIIGAGLGVNREVTCNILALDNQKISGELARIDLEPHEATINPSEEDIKTYWETLQDAFTTEPLRKFTYVIVTPNLPAEPAEDEAAPETLAEAAATDEAKAAAEKQKAEEKARKAAEHAEARRAKQMETDKLVDDFTFTLEEQKGAGFEELAAENQWEVKTSEFFGKSSPPEDLNVDLRASSRGGKAVDELFRIEPTDDPISKLSQPIAIGENQWLVARLDEEQPSRTKTFEEAKDQARTQYIAEKAAEAMKAAAEAAHAKIKESLAAGKSFADAARDAGIEETHTFERIGSDHTPDPLSEPANLFESTRNVDPGSLAELVTEPKRTFIIQVTKRELVKDENAASMLDSEVARRVNENETMAFVGWLTSRIEAAKVEALYRN
jgi:hypothetical protein